MSERSILSYAKKEQLTYIENLFLKYDTEKALSEVLINENMNLEISKLITEVVDNKKVKKHLKTINGIKKDTELNCYVKAMIISILERLNKPRILSEFINYLGKDMINKLYEYDRIDNKQLLKKYINNKNDEPLNTKKDRKKRKWPCILLIIIIITSLLIGIYFWINDMKLLKYYQNKVYPNFYIYDIDISKKEYDELDSIIDSIENNIKNKEITFKYDTLAKKYKLSDIGLTVESDSLLQELKDYPNKLSYKEKLKLIKSKEHQQFKLNINYDETKVDEVINELKKSFNKEKKEGSLTVDDNHNVKYIEGNDGFVLDEEKTKSDIINILENPTLTEKELNIELSGEVTKRTNTDDNLKSINKKVASYTTYFANYGSRGHNITLAASKANGTILQPGEIFSYRQTVGPYNMANGYQNAPIQQNGGTAYASGGGVCQLTTTIFNAQLLAGLETVYRTNHGAPVAYAPRGMDATVYGDSVDYKFKNSYKYPIYISAYTTSTSLTVDIWSNEEAMEGKKYKPYVVAKNNLEYLTYLEVYQNGKKIETKYVGYSYYLK